MKAVPKKDKFSWHLKIENEKDIYYLDSLIDVGDVVGKVDMRTTSRGERGDKRKVYLKIEVRKIDTDYANMVVRVGGEIIEAPEDVLKGNHTFNLRIGEEFDLFKREISKSFLKILDYVVSQKDFKLLGVVIDNKEATFGEITSNNVELLFEIKSKYKKGLDDSLINEYYQAVVKKLSEMAEKYDYIVLAGPGFAKETIYGLLSDELKKKVFKGDASITGVSGLRELVNRGYVEAVLREKELGAQKQYVEKFFELVSKQSPLVAYGIKSLKDAVSYGAVEVLIVCEEMLAKKEIRGLIDEALNSSAKVVFLSKIVEGYNQIKAFGGVVGILRFEI